MKILIATAVAAILLVALATELQGAPQITSEEMGRVVEQVKQRLASELNSAKAAQDAKYLNSYAQQFPWSQAHLNSYAQQGPYQESQATAQVRGAIIRNCGPAGSIINGALSPLNALFPNEFGVLVDCRENGNCVRVRVDVPADDRKADVRVCDLGNGRACVEVLAQSSRNCLGIPITIPVPLPNGQQVSIRITFSTGLPFLGIQGCASVSVDAPQCPQG